MEGPPNETRTGGAVRAHELGRNAVVLVDWRTETTPRQRVVVFIHNYPSPWSHWRGTDGSHTSDHFISEALADPEVRTVVLDPGEPHGDGLPDRGGPPITEALAELVAHIAGAREDDVRAGDLLEDVTLRLENLLADATGQPRPNLGAPYVPTYPGPGAG